MTGMNNAIERALGIPLQKSPVYTAKELLRYCYRGKERVIRDTSFDLRDLPFGEAARDLLFRRELEPWMIGLTLHHYDKSSAYLSACSSTNTGIGDPVHETENVKPGLPGIYRVTIENEPWDSIPIVETDQQWVTNDVLVFALDRGYEFKIHEAWVFLDYDRILGSRDEKRNWSRKIWNARTILKELGEMEAYEQVKIIAIVGVGSFATSKEKYPGLTLIHPNWWADVVGKHRVNMLCNIERYSREASPPVLVYSDGLYFVSSDRNARTAVPGILARVGQLGGYRHEYSFTLTQEIYEQAQGLTPGELVTLFHEVHNNGRK